MEVSSSSIWSICVRLVIVCQLFSYSSVGAICPYEGCTCTSYTDTRSALTCNSAGLDKLPDLKSGIGVDPVDTVFLIDNNIAEIPANSLPPNLTYLELTNNPIAHVSPDAFLDSATTLNTLVFGNAKFTKLPEAFLTLTNLTDLVISDTQIVEWNTTILTHLGQTLKTLALTNVGLTQWPAWINLLPSLTTLMLTNDSISTIPDDALSPEALNKLQSISLNYLGLQEVPKVLAGLTAADEVILHGNNIMLVENIPRTSMLVLSNNKLTDASKIVDALLPIGDTLWHLGLGSNQLKTIPDFSKFSKLGRVDLSENEISDDTTGSFPQSVVYINLAKNGLSNIPSAVRSALNVTELDLSFNDISEIPPDSLPERLTTLDLASNKITNIDFDNFPQRLSRLELQDNVIDTIPAANLSTPSSMRYLMLDRNPITSIHPTAFQSLQGLTQLYLYRTKLTEIPVALTSLTSLTILDMRDINSLTCNCPPQPNLTQWLDNQRDKTLTPGDDYLLINGRCNNGTVPIDIFISDYYCSNRPSTEEPDPYPHQASTQRSGNTAACAQCHGSLVLFLGIMGIYLTGQRLWLTAI